MKINFMTGDITKVAGRFDVIVNAANSTLLAAEEQTVLSIKLPVRSFSKNVKHQMDAKPEQQKLQEPTIFPVRELFIRQDRSIQKIPSMRRSYSFSHTSILSMQRWQTATERSLFLPFPLVFINIRQRKQLRLLKERHISWEKSFRIWN